MARKFDADRRKFLVGAPMALGAAALTGDAAHQEPASGSIEKRASLSRRIDFLYAAYDKPRIPGGVAALIYKGELLHLKAYGAANREFDVRWTPDTRYRMASVTKSFTATALLALEDQGRLRLNDPLRKHLPDFPDLGAPITLHHLVTMTSGLWQDETLLGLASLRGRVTLDDMYALVKRQRKLNYAPGSATTYIDSNFRILARVIATVTGKSYWDAMQDLVFRPLGMESSFVAPNINRYYDGQAPTYLSEEEGELPTLLAVPFPASGDGSMISTMRDLVKWLEHLRRDYRNPRSLFARMTAPFTLTDGTTAFYRRGISVREHRGLVGWGHGGFTGTDYVFWPDLDLIVANFHNNLGVVSKSEVSIQLTDAFLQEEPGLLGAAEAGPKSVPLSHEELDLLSGTFVEVEHGYVLESTAADPPASSVRYEFLGSQTRVQKSAEGRFETPATHWPLRLSIEAAPCQGCRQRDLMIRHADWPAPRRFVRAAPLDPARVPAADYVGHFRSAQLGVCYSVVRAGTGLDLLVAAGVAATQVLHLTPLSPGVFRARSDDREFKDLFGLGTVSVKFTRGAVGRVSGMRLSVDRVRDLDFEKTT